MHDLRGPRQHDEERGPAQHGLKSKPVHAWKVDPAPPARGATRHSAARRSGRLARRGAPAASPRDAGNARDAHDRQHNASIECADAKQQTGQESRERERAEQAHDDTRTDHEPRLLCHQRHDLPRRRPERHSHRQLSATLRDEVRQDRVRARHCQQQRRNGVRGHESSGRDHRRARIANDVSERCDLIRRDFGVDVRDHAAHGRDETLRIPCRPNDERDLGAERHVRVGTESGDIQLGTRGLGEAAILRIRHHADDRHPWSAGPEPQAMADGVGVVSPDLPREPLAYHQRRVPRVRVIVREHSATQDRDAHRLEVASGDDTIIRERVGSVGAEWSPLERHGLIASSRVERQCVRQRGRRHTRNLPGIREDAPQHRLARRAVAELLVRQVDAKCHRRVGPEAQAHVLDGACRRDEQPRPVKQQYRECHLPRREQSPHSGRRHPSTTCRSIAECACRIAPGGDCNRECADDRTDDQAPPPP